MARFSIIPVRHSSEEQKFLQLPNQLHRHDPYWVAPLHREIRSIFSPQHNPIFREGGQAQRWVLQDQAGKVKGRIAAFFHPRQAANFPHPSGGIGFFACIDHLEAAHTLFDTAKEWLYHLGLKGMTGPVNFGENDRHWGLMIAGKGSPAFGMPYHPPYYQTLFESYGFAPYYTQQTHRMSLDRPLPDRLQKIGQWVSQKPGIEFGFGSARAPMHFGRIMQEVYNEAWQFHDHFTPMTDEKIRGLIRHFRPLAIDYFLPYATVRGEPAAFMICIPDLNPIIQPFQGQPGLGQGLRFLWRKRNQYRWYLDRGILTQGRVIIMGVKPKFQRYGLESGLIAHTFERASRLGFQKMELGWVGDFNPRMLKICEETGAEKTFVHQTYYCPFETGTALPEVHIL